MSEKKISSGTKKAQSLENKKTRAAESAEEGAKTAGTAKAEAAPELTKAEKKKLNAAKARAEREKKQQALKAEKQKKREEQAATAEERREERRHERMMKAQQLKSKTREQQIEDKKQARMAKIEAAKARREARLNAKIARREHNLKVREERRKAKKQRTPGFGGWLAAVIALGVSTLALGTMLTFGWINMNGIQADMAADASHSLYELNAIVDNLDANLAKARIASSAGDRTKIFTDIAIESEMAESALERLPVAGEMTRNMTSFINKVGESAQNMLYTVARGRSLSSSQTAAIEYMYECNGKIKQFLNELTASCDDKQIIEALKGKGVMFENFEGYIDPAVETPSEIHDGPFAENVQQGNAKYVQGAEEISPERAEELALQYFADYKITDAQCTGEAVGGQLMLFNISMQTDDGEYFAQISKAGGKLVMFDSYKECKDRNFTVENCRRIAEDFLEKAGYGGMTCVWAGENGTTCDLNYVYEQNGVAVYPDMIKVKVCEERGIVTGIEALPYVLNHTARSIARPKMNMAEAKSLVENYDVQSARLALIPFDGGEKLAYEFVINYGGRTYYVYLDADGGAELEVFTLVGDMLL